MQYDNKREEMNYAKKECKEFLDKMSQKDIKAHILFETENSKFVGTLSNGITADAMLNFIIYLLGNSRTYRDIVLGNIFEQIRHESILNTENISNKISISMN